MVDIRWWEQHKETAPQVGPEIQRSAPDSASYDVTRKIPNKAKKVRLWEIQAGLCNWCGKPLDSLRTATFDHIIPKSHGGTLEVGNVQLLHLECNQEKGDRCPGCPRCELRQLMEERKKRSMEPNTYFKLPPRITAVQLSKDSLKNIVMWLPADMFLEASNMDKPYLIVLTTAGPRRVEEGEWVCQRDSGSWFFCTPEQFTASYAPWDGTP